MTYVCIHCKRTIGTNDDEPQRTVKSVCNDCNNTPERMAQYRQLLHEEGYSR